MKTKLSQKDFKEVLKSLEYLSDEQLTELFIETEQLYFKNIDWGKIDKSNPLMKNIQFDQKGGAFYNRNLNRWFDQKTTSTYKPKFKDITNLSKNVIINLNSKDTAKLFLMMLMFQSIEWACYMVFDQNLPEIKDVFVGEKTTDVFEFDVSSFVVVPQKTNSAHVEFYNQEYPELMQEIVQYRIKKYYTTGRLHSHHTMSAFHSGTDNNEFDKHLEVGDKYLSIVVAFDKNNKFPKSEKVVTVENYKNFYEGLSFHTKLGLPDKDKELSEMGVIIECEVEMSEITQDDIDEAYNFYSQYVEMIDYIKQTETTFKTLSLMADTNKIEPEEEYEIRGLLKESPLMLKSFNILSILTQKSLQETKESLKILEEFKKDYLKFGQQYGIIEKPKPTVYNSPYVSNQNKVYGQDTKKEEKKDKAPVRKVKAQGDSTYYKVALDHKDVLLKVTCICHFCKEKSVCEFKLKSENEQIEFYCSNDKCKKGLHFSLEKSKKK